MTHTPIPITVLTGFLGSGKTTVLNHLLCQPELKGTVVIINEFGEVGLDHLLVESGEEQYALLDNGCVCCTVRNDLIAALKQLDKAAGSGEIPPISRVVIETTGLADPVPILHTLMVEADLMARYAVDGVVTTVDAVNGLSTLDAHPEAVKQVAVADRLLITKSDLAARSEVDNLDRTLRAVCPTAACACVAKGKVAAMDILESGLFDISSKSADVTAWFEEAAQSANRERHSADRSHGECAHRGHHHSHGTHDVQSYSFVIDDPVDWPALQQWLEYVAALKGEDLLRFKGLVNVAGQSDRPVVVHGVQHVFHPPTALDGWPTEDRRTRLIFIVRNIPRQAIERTLVRFASISSDRLSRPMPKTASSYPASRGPRP